MPRRPPANDGLDKTVARFDDSSRRLDVLEKPDGSQLFQALTKVQQLISNIGTYVNAYLAAGFTTGSMHATGNVTVDGALSAGASGITTGGGVSASGDLHGVNIYATAAPGYNMTGGRVAGWWETATGRGGTASSSQRFKSVLIEADIDERAKKILQVTVGYFQYLAEVGRRDDPTSPDYVGADYHVSTNLGAIAEQLHELGLWEWVVYERDLVTATMADADGAEHEVVVGEQLRLNASGEPIPFAIHDILIGYADLIVSQYQEKRLARLEAWAADQGFTAAAE